MAYIGRNAGPIWQPPSVRRTLDDSEIVYVGILPTPLHEDGSRMRDMLMLRLNVTEVAAR